MINTDDIIKEHNIFNANDEAEYLTLINYLTMYVNLQEALVDKIYVVSNENEYIILDVKQKEIFSVINYDDALLDVIITIAPKRIKICNADKFKNKELLRVIVSIFKERADICMETM